jgi:hypothetical protein
MVENIAVSGLVSTHDPVKGLQQCLIREASRFWASLLFSIRRPRFSGACMNYGWCACVPARVGHLELI